MEGLKIAKGGKLLETKWIYDEEKEEGSYKTFNITNRAISKLFDTCELEEDVTLKDIFLLLNTEIDIFDSILGNWCKELVTEGLTQSAKEYNLLNYDPEQIEYLELIYTPEYDLYEDVNGKDIDYLYGFHRPDFNGVGIILQNDNDIEHFKKGERVPWGISFTPTNELINIPIRLSKKFVIWEGILKTPISTKSKKLVELENPTYTLGQILNGIIWELSFHGGPENRKKKLDEITKIADDIKEEGEE